MKIKWLVDYYHRGHPYKSGDVCDVTDEFGAGCVKHKRAELVTSSTAAEKAKSTEPETAMLEPATEKSVKPTGKPRK